MVNFICTRNNILKEKSQLTFLYRQQKTIFSSYKSDIIHLMKNIVTIGGGTGSYTVLMGLKELKDISLFALVSMADNGGSTGVLRDELGVLPPGDVRQCLVALSEHSDIVRKLMNYRFSEGSLTGHSFGNILLAALEKVTGDFARGVEVASEILKVKGK